MPIAFVSVNIILGELQSVDGYMNIALEKTEEYVNGKLRRNYGDAFIRGNNGTKIPKIIGYNMGANWGKKFSTSLEISSGCFIHYSFM